MEIKPAAGFFGGKSVFKISRQIFGSNAHAMIADVEVDLCLVFLTTADGQPLPFIGQRIHRFGAIFNQFGQDLQNLVTLRDYGSVGLYSRTTTTPCF